MGRLLILTAGELTRDPRARRAAEAGLAHGWDVQGLCVSSESAVTLDGVAVTRVGTARVDNALRESGLGGQARSSRPLRELRGVYRLVRHLVVTCKLVRAGRRLGAFDAVHVNDFDTLPAGVLLSRVGNPRLIYDSHEIYTLQEPNPPRLFSRVVLAAERILAPRAETVLTVNEEIAEDLAARLRLRTRPTAVLNCASLDPIEPSFTSDGPLLAVYQGAMGPGRFLEDLLAAVEGTLGVRLTIRVKGTDTGALRAIVGRRGLDDRVVIAEPVSPDALVESLRGFDVGLVINRPVTRNDELVLPNKLFEYLMAGVAVVAPALPSLRALIERERVGLTFTPGDNRALGATLTRLQDDRELLLALRRRAREAAVSQFNAESQAVLLERAWKGER